MTIANLALLKEAFIWEQERMQARMDEMKNHPVEQNEMKKLLKDAWISYFQQLKGSDQREIDICTQAIEIEGSLNEAQAKDLITTDISNDIEYKDVAADIINFIK